MRKEILTLTTKVFKSLARVALIATLAISVPMLNACSDDDTSTETPSPGKGDEPNQTGNPDGFVYNGGNKECAAAKSSISFTFEADAGFTLSTDKSDMIEFLTPEQSSTGGTFNSTIQVAANSSNEERKANIYITVEGHDRTLLFTVTQAAATIDDIKDELLKYVDKRLVEEYYWLDEYNEKRATFDFTLSAEEYLDESLSSMTTNIADGGYDYEGNRYVYSYFMQISGGRSEATRAGQQVTGYGVVLSTTLWAMNNQGTEYGLGVVHVYPDSPAAAQGLQRGDIIYQYNGAALKSNNLNNAFYDIYYSLSTSVKLGVRNLSSGESRTISLSAAAYYETPIAHHDVYEMTDAEGNVTKIGYLSYLTFDSSYNDELISALRDIDSGEIDEMILDLRCNGGGSVNTSTLLASSLVSSAYNNQTYQTLKRHASNPKGNTTCSITNAYDGQALPRLDLERLFVITSGSTASASEMVITGLRGLGIDVVTIGLQTEGKNCGMDVTQITDKTGTYEYAPITFLNFNAEDFNDFADGIPADRDMDYIAQNAKNETVRDLADSFILPLEPWGGYSYDMGMMEALMQIQGKSIIDIPADDASSHYAAMPALKPAHKLNATRAGEIALPVINAGKRIVKGATLTEEERIAFDSQSYK